MENELSGELLDVSASLLPVPLASQRLFGALFLAGLQIERVALDFFDDVFLLDLTLEAPKGALQRLTILDMYFSQSSNHLPSRKHA